MIENAQSLQRRTNHTEPTTEVGMTIVLGELSKQDIKKGWKMCLSRMKQGLVLTTRE